MDDALQALEARIRSLGPCTLPGDRPYWMAGVEDDRYGREAGVWKHASMKLRVVFMSPYERGWARSAKEVRR